MVNQQINEWQNIREKGMFPFIFNSRLLWSGIAIATPIFIIYLLFVLLVDRKTTPWVGILLFLFVLIEKIIKKIIEWKRLEKKFISQLHK